MCDIEILDRQSNWPRWYQCQRDGKYTVPVTIENYYGKEEPEYADICICGQHKSLLERGHRLTARIPNRATRTARVFGDLSEKGAAQKRLKNAKQEREAAQRRLTWEQERTGRTVLWSLSDLRLAIQDNPALSDLVNQLEKLQDAKNELTEAAFNESRAEAKLEELKG